MDAHLDLCSVEDDKPGSERPGRATWVVPNTMTRLRCLIKAALSVEGVEHATAAGQAEENVSEAEGSRRLEPLVLAVAEARARDTGDTAPGVSPGEGIEVVALERLFAAVYGAPFDGSPQGFRSVGDAVAALGDVCRVGDGRVMPLGRERGSVDSLVVHKVRGAGLVAAEGVCGDASGARARRLGQPGGCTICGALGLSLLKGGTGDAAGRKRGIIDSLAGAQGEGWVVGRWTAQDSCVVGHLMAQCRHNLPTLSHHLVLPDLTTVARPVLSSPPAPWFLLERLLQMHRIGSQHFKSVRSHLAASTCPKRRPMPACLV